MDIINHSAGLIMPFHILDAVIRGIHPAMRLLSPTQTPTQLEVYCVLHLHLSVVWWRILRVKQWPLNCIQRWWENFDKLLCHYILDTMLYSDTQNYMDFLDSNLQWQSFKFNLHLLLLHLVGWVLLCHYVYHIKCVFTCISTCALVILKTCLNWCIPDWKSHCLSCNIHNSALE